ISRALVNELRILSHAPLREHRNLVHLFGICWDRDDSSPSVWVKPCSPCADRGTLERRLRAKGDLPWETRVNFVNQILSGLTASHSCHITHGDLKPDNVLAFTDLATQKTVLKLCDFGFSLIL
ncbi:kinase-like domain-containing protein, partial [Lasiosphaeria ovina]